MSYVIERLIVLEILHGRLSWLQAGINKHLTRLETCVARANHLKHFTMLPSVALFRLSASALTP